MREKYSSDNSKSESSPDYGMIELFHDIYRDNHKSFI